MASKRIDNLNALDWDDSALIKAYNKGMSLRIKDFEEENCKDRRRDSKKDEAKEFEEENSKDRRRSSKKHEWKVGDYCRAVYPADNLLYEAKVTHTSGDYCTVDFLGYHEEAEIDMDALVKSKGKLARKKQIKSAKEYFPAASADESASGDDIGNDYSEMESPRPKKRDGHHGNHMGDHSADYTAADNTFQHAVYPAPGHCNGMQPAATMMPPAPPMLHTPEVAQNPALCAMLSSWYMAGYYTGLHQGQKGQCHQRYCCRTSQNCCHH